jgi:glycosyltransferase involved in cell wall biosynthesis
VTLRSQRALVQSLQPHITRPVRRVIRRVRGRFERGIYFVVGPGKWVFYWEARLIAEALRGSGPSAHVVTDSGGFRDQIVHFVDRYSYLDGTHRLLHSSNSVFLNWYHGFLPDLETAEADRLHEALREALPRLRRVVASCTAGREGLLVLGVPAENIVQIPLSVELGRFAPPPDEQSREEVRRSLGIPSDAFCIGSFQKDGVGWGDGLEPKLIKGPDTFLATIQLLREQAEGGLFVLLTGPARGYVKGGLDRLGVPYAHRFVSDYRLLGRYYHALDGYLITARSEGGPKAFLESWASGVPVVSTRVGMPADLIVHEESGMLADIGDANGLAAGMQLLKDDSERRSRCVRNGLSEVRSFSSAGVAGRYLSELYAPLLNA